MKIHHIFLLISFTSKRQKKTLSAVCCQQRWR